MPRQAVALSEEENIRLRELAWQRRREFGGRASVSKVIMEWVKEGLARQSQEADRKPAGDA